MISTGRTGTIFLILAILFLTSSFLKGQYKSESHPRLVVGIVVDQMRYDYITRFWDKYQDDGFKRIIKDGYFFENTHYSYAPTYTAPGHASIYTGTTPSVHGIIGNGWYEKYSEAVMYCVEDTSVQTVGAPGSAGLMSPKNLLASTFADQLKLAFNLKSKTIGVSLKDRGAILPAGHSADGAYWFDGASGDWITSTFYRSELPLWVASLNDENLPQELLSQNWNTLRPIEEYTESLADNNPFERPPLAGSLPVFPYDLKKLSEKLGVGLIRSTPFGNTITTEFAKRAIIEEELGMDEIPDFLAVSYSSTDYIGHQYGPRSIELEDTYLRLDQDLASLLKFLDAHVGDNAYTLFLTADHGAVETPLFLENQNIPAGYFQIEKFKTGLNEYLNSTIGKEKWIKNISNDQVFIDHALVRKKKINLDKVIAAISDFAIAFEGVADVISAKDLKSGNYNYNKLAVLQRGFYQKRSGDIIIILEPNWITYFRQGTTHGSAYDYDTHVPLLFFGNGIKSGSSFTRVHISDIAPTLSALLHIQGPNAATGKIHTEMKEE